MQTIDQTLGIIEAIDHFAYGVRVFNTNPRTNPDLKDSYIKLKEAIADFQSNIEDHDANILSSSNTWA